MAVQQIEEKNIVLDGNIISYLEANSGEVVIFLHDSGNSKEIWTESFEYLNNKKVIALDVPDLQSPPGATVRRKDIILMSNLIHRFVQLLNFHSITLVGHGVGALIALQLAMDNVSWCSQVILVSPKLILHPKSLGLGIYKRVKQKLKSTMSFEVTRENDLHLKFTINDFIRLNTIPTLFVVGENSQSNIEHYKKIVEQTLQSEYCLIPDSYDYPFFEKPSVFYPSIQYWMENQKKCA